MVVGCLWVDGARRLHCCGLHERNGLIQKMRRKEEEVSRISFLLALLFLVLHGFIM